MTSRFTAEALRPGSEAAATLANFLHYLNRWEACGGTFLRNSTATGLRVTISSTLPVLEYLTKSVGYRYLMTSRLSTDPLENFFGIVRQSSGCNAHPSPEQFLVTINLLSFSNLARSVDGANANPDVVSALMSVDDKENVPIKPKKIDEMLSEGRLDEAEVSLEKTKSSMQHFSFVVEKSDSRLIYYVAGYVARKCVLQLKCTLCKDLLLVQSAKAAAEGLPSSFTEYCDWGGLLYPSRELHNFISCLENIFTECFSLRKLHTNSVCDVLAQVKANFLPRNSVGCTEHVREVSVKIISFYILTRLHFLVKGINSSNATKRQRAKHLKLSRST